MGLDWKSEGVRKHAKDFVTDVNTLNGIFNELDEATRKLPGGWDGNDANEYASNFKVSSRNFNYIIGKCKDYEKFLNEVVNAGYNHEENELADAVSEAYLA